MRDGLTPTRINTDLYDPVASTYDDFYSDNRCLAENREVIEMLNRHCNLEDSVIDLGCGTGILLDYLAEQIAVTDYTGLDCSIQMLIRARLKHRDYSFVLGDYSSEGEPLIEDKFRNVIALFGGLSYIPLSDAFKTVDNLLDQYGKCFLMFYGTGHYSRILHEGDMSVSVSVEEVREVANRYDICGPIEYYGAGQNFVIMKGVR